MPALSRTVPLAAGALIAALAVGASVPEPPPGSPPTRASVDDNPCVTPRAKQLRCPDLRMKRPFGLHAQRTSGGRMLLRAGNSIDNVGRGPVEVHGNRIGPRFMRGRQRIYKRGGGRIGLRTGARLQFKLAHGGRRYWKLFRAASFELWRLDRRGRRKRLVRRGPKIAYCLRDLRRTHPVRRSPRRRVYPACSTNPRRRKVTLGTSVGWSDIYPATYPEQWINVTGLRGCFAYVHTADPRNRIYESSEDNNEAQVIVRLPFRPGPQRCRGRSTGEVNRESGPYY